MPMFNLNISAVPTTETELEQMQEALGSIGLKWSSGKEAKDKTAFPLNCLGKYAISTRASGGGSFGYVSKSHVSKEGKRTVAEFCNEIAKFLPQQP